MVVVTIVSILVVIAMPVYVEYATRSKIASALGFMGEAKTAVTERFYSSHSMPIDNATAGLSDPNSYGEYDFIARLEVSSIPVPGVITVTLDLPNTPADRKLMQLVPDTNADDEIIWTCGPAPPPDGIDLKYLPSSCRGG